jgi:4-amino-4-deoxychorismate lyase
MCPLFESIQLENGMFSRLEYHQSRIDHSCFQVFGKIPSWRLKSQLESEAIPQQGLYKCRVTYNQDLAKVEFHPYEMKPIKSLKLIWDNAIAYDHKWQDRTSLMKLVDQRGECDEILIVKNGMITDSSYSNIVFEKGGKWFTPSTFLLRGTMRQYLLDVGTIQEWEITQENFREFHSFRLINAMLQWESPAIEVSNIY